jgi:uncharacterized membrane protein YoaK (UPF0700 family)
VDNIVIVVLSLIGGILLVSTLLLVAAIQLSVEVFILERYGKRLRVKTQKVLSVVVWALTTMIFLSYYFPTHTIINTGSALVALGIVATFSIILKKTKRKD